MAWGEGGWGRLQGMGGVGALACGYPVFKRWVHGYNGGARGRGFVWGWDGNMTRFCFLSVVRSQVMLQFGGAGVQLC